MAGWLEEVNTATGERNVRPPARKAIMSASASATLMERAVSGRSKPSPSNTSIVL